MEHSTDTSFKKPLIPPSSLYCLCCGTVIANETDENGRDTEVYMTVSGGGPVS
ncbi:hypothetical protein J6590_066353 [Homalodisca vitripennis]|nr:hypothetical protein J6590_066353 [Homalodisca vitripennis]